MEAENWVHALYFLEESSQFRCASTFFSIDIKKEAIFLIKYGIA